MPVPRRRRTHDTTPDVPSTTLAARPPAEQTRDEIARRAFERYLARGGEHGYDQDDWLQAERELGRLKAGAADAAV